MFEFKEGKLFLFKAKPEEQNISVKIIDIKKENILN